VFAAGVVESTRLGHHPVGAPAETPAVVSDPGVGPAGPATGTDIATYVAARASALRAARGHTVAVVSFTQYRTKTDALALLHGLDVAALLVVAPGGQPEVVSGDLAVWASAQRAGAAANRHEIQQLLPSVDDPSFRAFYVSEVSRLAVLMRADASAPVVFGAVVSGLAAQERALGRRPEVRLVDPVGGVVPPFTAVRGLRPEETVTSGTPDTRPVS
jgi:hypothetical protein